MKTVKTLAAIRKLVASTTGDVYIRWSRGPKYDERGGWRSMDYATGHYDGGLSVVRCHVGTDYDLVSAIAEYAYLDHPVCYLVTGDEVGTGSDGEPTITNCVPLVRIHPSLVLPIEQREMMRLCVELADREAHLASLDAAACRASLGVAVDQVYTLRRQIRMLESGAPWHECEPHRSWMQLWGAERDALVAHYLTTGQVAADTLDLITNT